MNWYQVVRFFHIGSAILFIGGIFSRQVVRSLAGKAGDVHQFAAMHTAAARIESTLVIPGNMAVIGFGILYALQLKAPILGFLQGASSNWLLACNLLLVLGMLLVPLFFLPRGKKFDLALQDALAANEMTPELRHQMNDPQVKLAHSLELILLVVVVILMVFRPF
jgi:uncharacterized membrane protein